MGKTYIKLAQNLGGDSSNNKPLQGNQSSGENTKLKSLQTGNQSDNSLPKAGNEISGTTFNNQSGENGDVKANNQSAKGGDAKLKSLSGDTFTKLGGTADTFTGQVNEVVSIKLPAPFDTPVMHDAGLIGIGLLTGIFLTLLCSR